MNNPNPFVPKGSLLDQQNKRRTHMRFGVLCVLTVSVASLMIMLIQGCTQKKDTTPTDANTTTPPPPDTATNLGESNPPPIDVSTQAPVLTPTNIVTAMPPVTPVTPPVTPPPQQVTPLPPSTPDTSGEYTVVKGDSLAKIAKKNGVTLKALVAANPDAKPTKLKIGQKLVLPAGKTVADATAAPAPGTADTAEESYTVKSGDTLTKIAKAHHVKVKALMAANALTTSQITVGRKLKIPSKAEATAAAVPTETAPPNDTSTQAPPMPPVNTTPPATTPPAPGQH